MSTKDNGTTDQEYSTDKIKDDDELVEDGLDIITLVVDDHLTHPQLFSSTVNFAAEIESVYDDIDYAKDVFCVVFDFACDFIDLKVSSYADIIVITHDIDSYAESKSNRPDEECPHNLADKLHKNKTNMDRAFKNAGEAVLEYTQDK